MFSQLVSFLYLSSAWSSHPKMTSHKVRAQKKSTNITMGNKNLLPLLGTIIPFSPQFLHPKFHRRNSADWRENPQTYFKIWIFLCVFSSKKWHMKMHSSSRWRYIVEEYMVYLYIYKYFFFKLPDACRIYSKEISLSKPFGDFVERQENQLFKYNITSFQTWAEARI